MSFPNDYYFTIVKLLTDVSQICDDGVVKMAERVARSKEALTEAALILLRHEAINRITITQVCQLANVTRPTFYQHYRSVDDLISQAIADRLQQHQDTAFALDADAPEAEFDAALGRFLSLIWDDRNLVAILRSSDINLAQLQMASVATIARQIVTRMPDSDDPEVWLRARFAAAGVTELLGAWLATPDPGTQQKMYTRLLQELIHAVLAG